MGEIQIAVSRVDGLAAQLIEPICEQIDGCVRVDAGLNGYAFVFDDDVDSIDAWQRVHEALLVVDPGAARLALAAEPPAPIAEPGPPAALTRVEMDLPETPPPTW
ncbi:MAG: hypothetical protein QOG62_392 [Thermoleophilaceae bacterium]|jgi:hypothetical protein|nr:hypothetical protein [Thermoleophilaceae bacterium]